MTLGTADAPHRSFRNVVIDANVFISLVTERDQVQRAKGETLLEGAERGELVDVGDAAILAVAIEHRYTLATFDRKLSNRAKSFGVAPYW